MADPQLPKVTAQATVDLTGRRLGDYQFLRRLGSGGMADVYLAEQLALRRQVACKVLKPELAIDTTYVQRFRQEAQAAALFVHPNVVQIFEVGAADGLHFIAEEYVPGQNLAQRINRNGPPDLRISLAIMRQVAAALHLAAQRGIVHRDIKPENILLSTDGRVKVADFGLARVAGGGLNLTQVGVTMGTPLYMSPEQVEGKPLDPRSDLYSLGVTCYHMLAGLPPFRGETAIAVAVQHLRSQPARLENLRPDLPPALCRIVHRLLAKDPAERYASARELWRELRAIQVPGAEPDEAEELDGMAGEFAAAVTGRFEATQRLESLMKTTSLLIPSRRKKIARIAALIGAMALALMLGGAVAWATRERPLLADADARHTHIDKQPSAQGQFLFAAFANPPELGYRAVLEHYPDNDYWRRRAEQELALIYLRGDDYAKAGRVFDQLATAADDEFRGFGLAGQCVLLSLSGKRQPSIEKLAELAPLAGRIDPRMQQIVRRVVQENRQALGREKNEEWKDWLNEHFGDADGAGSK